MVRSLIHRLAALEDAMAPADPLVIIINCFDDAPLSGFDVQGIGLVSREAGESDEALSDRAIGSAMPARIVVLKEVRQTAGR